MSLAEGHRAESVLTERLAGAAQSIAVPDWERAPQFGRRETILRTLRQLYGMHPGPVCIVETGTLRDISPGAREAQGWSTLAWGWYCSQTGSRLYTVDLYPPAFDVCRPMTLAYEPAIEYVVADSLWFLRDWGKVRRGDIHLLYLDSFDYFEGQREQSELHHLAEAQAALPVLATHCLVLIDDTYRDANVREEDGIAFVGKGARAVPFLMGQGFRLEWCEQGQALLSR